jgi:pyruvate/2-oxoglutarate dehydrogenase complex dihydrolipoamide dehydrogenase (E3) component
MENIKYKMQTTQTQNNQSIWQTTSFQSGYSTFKGKSYTEVAVVGGGITGLTCALLIQRAGKKVTLPRFRRQIFQRYSETVRIEEGTDNSRLNAFFPD